jgi:hypothetical protein
MVKDQIHARGVYLAFYRIIGKIKTLHRDEWKLREKENSIYLGKEVIQSSPPDCISAGKESRIGYIKYSHYNPVQIQIPAKKIVIVKP